MSVVAARLCQIILPFNLMEPRGLDGINPIHTIKHFLHFPAEPSVVTWLATKDLYRSSFTSRHGIEMTFGSRAGTVIG